MLINTSDGSNKFWELYHDPSNKNLIRRWGKIGTHGQSQVLTKSIREITKIIQDKLRDGYVLKDAGLEQSDRLSSLSSKLQSNMDDTDEDDTDEDDAHTEVSKPLARATSPRPEPKIVFRGITTPSTADVSF